MEELQSSKVWHNFKIRLETEMFHYNEKAGIGTSVINEMNLENKANTENRFETWKFDHMHTQQIKRGKPIDAQIKILLIQHNQMILVVSGENK